jgi:hypothetical protein
MERYRTRTFCTLYLLLLACPLSVHAEFLGNRPLPSSKKNAHAKREKWVQKLCTQIQRTHTAQPYATKCVQKIKKYEQEAAYLEKVTEPLENTYSPAQEEPNPSIEYKPTQFQKTRPHRLLN